MPGIKNVKNILLEIQKNLLQTTNQTFYSPQGNSMLKIYSLGSKDQFHYDISLLEIRILHVLWSYKENSER